MGQEALNIRPLSDEPVVTPEFVKTNFLFGVDLRDGDGAEMPPSLFQFYIRSAQQQFEKDLGVYLTPHEIENESHDFYYDDYANFNFLKLLRLPVRKVTALSLQFPMYSNRMEFNPDWFQVESASGQMNLLPSAGSISQMIVSSGGAFLPAMQGLDYIPHGWRLNYECGFDVGKVPSDILELIGMMAAMGPLNIAGDLIAGAGIANKSLGLDGLSQSIGTTSSATNAGYGARIIQYEKQIKERMHALRGFYRPIAMVVA